MEKLINTATLEVKKSKFIAYIYRIETKEDAEKILNILKQEHKNARHIPYAYKLSNTGKKSNDKEPIEIPIYNLIERNNLNNTFIAVVRYFGGTKLGAGLLMRTYLNTVIEAIKKEDN